MALAGLFGTAFFCGTAVAYQVPQSVREQADQYRQMSQEMIANGRVTKPGRTLTVCAGDVLTVADGREQLVAAMQATMMTVTGRDDLWA